MITTKIYQYDSSQESNGYRGTDYSKYVLQGAEITEDITQELDTAELTLCGLNTNKEFEPESKFIIDILETNEFGEDVIVQTHHFCVARDIVSQPILSDDTYFDHHISFIEPSVVAQKRLVDNIATTYKLKDVSLKEIPAYPDTNAVFSNQSSRFSPSQKFGVTFNSWDDDEVFGKYFQFDGTIKMLREDGTETSKGYVDIEDYKISDGIYRAKFKIPKMAIYGGVINTKNFKFMGYASIKYLIEEFSLTDEYNPLRSWNGSFISNSKLSYKEAAIIYDDSTPNEVYTPSIDDAMFGEWICERIDNQQYFYYRKYTETSASTPTYITSTIDIKPDMMYKITISLYEFSDNLPVSTSGVRKYTDGQPTYFAKINRPILGSSTSSYSKLTSSQTSGVSSFVAYSLNAPINVVYSSSVPYSALALLQKAIINSSIYEKKDGVYIADVNNSNLPFYIDTNYVDRLAATLIIENFYNQKNLWEIMLEVGNYIHSIPELKFGADDRFMITFNELGRTDEKQSETNNVSVFNSRSVEDYISATSSYITNMVQLGGVIEEWVVPKTTNETLLVSNDTAEIITSKPIIELLSITARDNNTGVEADLTEYIYEENVYKTLQIDYDVVPNRGIAMFYKLGTNVITGG